MGDKAPILTVMGSCDFPKSAISGAYKLFLEEMDKHLSTAKGVFDKGNQFDLAEARRIAASFHTIRGGAGFFGLDQIGAVALKLEEMYEKGSLTVATDEARQLLEEMTKLFKELPK